MKGRNQVIALFHFPFAAIAAVLILPQWAVDQSIKKAACFDYHKHILT